jgi:hypothetical protein
MKRLAFLLCLLFCLPPTAHADAASKHAKVQEMLELLRIDRAMDQVMNMVQQQATADTNAQLTGKGASEDQKARVDAFQKQLFQFVEDQIGWKSMQNDYIDMYSQTFTEDEIDGILAFYKSPAGAALIAKTPELTSKASVLVAKKMLTLKPEIQKMVQDFASTVGKHSGPTINSN